MKYLFITIVIVLNLFTLNAQQKYWISFIDKDTKEFNPYNYFNPSAIQKKIARNQNLFDYYDLPVNQYYINAITQNGIKILQQSRWLNAIAVKANSNEIELLKSYHFIKNIVPISSVCSISKDYYDTIYIKEKLDTLLDMQLEEFESEYFYKNNIDGSGITIAVLDGGFPNVDKHPVFKHLFDNNQIIATYDFVKKREFVYAFNSHGTSVLSCIAGKINDKNMGLATGAKFLLARTEVNTEPFSEEENWLAAIEWAHANGADIVSSSLGYGYHRYFTTHMDGHYSYVAQAARIAARKGLLVINAMGNEGYEYWHTLITPADVDSVLSIGGIEPSTGLHIPFSSFGPNANMQFKPNVVAFGNAIVAGKRNFKSAFGTSFSTPLISGFAACVWQLNPKANNMEIFRLIEKSGHLYPYYDYAHGYGIPKASYFFDSIEPSKSNSIEIVESNNDIVISIPEEYIKTNEYVYCHLENNKGYLNWYKVFAIKEKKKFFYKIKSEDINKKETLRIYYCNTIKTYTKP